MQKELINTQFLRAAQKHVPVFMILEVRPKIKKKNQYCFCRYLFNTFNMLRGR